MESFDLKCRSCGAPLAQENLIAALAMARCAQCGTVSGVKGVKDWERGAGPLPKGFRLEEDGDTVVILYDGGGFQPRVLLLFAFMGSATLLFFGGLFRQIIGQFSLLDILYVSALPILGMTFAILDAAGLLHRVRLRASREGVSVATGPMPSLREKSVSAAAITQVFTREFRGEETGLTYEVVARGRAGGLTILVANLPEAPQALYFERRIEKALGLKDIPVPGELPRSGA